MRKSITSLCLILCSLSSFAQTEQLREKIETIAFYGNTKVGVAFVGEKRGVYTNYFINETTPFPTASVYKFYLALTILDRVDKGMYSLSQAIFITKKDLLPDTTIHSPLRDDYPEGNIYLSIADLLEYTVSKSDNNACDILLRLLGGPATVDKFIKELGVQGIEVKCTGEYMHKNFEDQYLNTSTPEATLQLLQLFYNGKIVSDKSQLFLWNIMEKSETGENKIKGLLPENVIVAHKAGISSRNEAGIKAADNDAGIVLLPDRSVFYLVVFISDSMESDETNAEIIAEIAKAVYDFVQQD